MAALSMVKVLRELANLRGLQVWRGVQHDGFVITNGVSAFTFRVSPGELAQASFARPGWSCAFVARAREVPAWSSPEKKHGVIRLPRAGRRGESFSATWISAFLPTSSSSAAQRYSSCAAQLFDAWPAL